MDKDTKDIDVKSFAFAVKIVKLCAKLQKKPEAALCRPLLSCGTGVGALVAEASQAQGRPDFYAKINVALIECSKTLYWLRLLKESDCLTEAEQAPILLECVELERVLTATLKKNTSSTPYYSMV